MTERNPKTIFVLSPANLSGRRARFLLAPRSRAPLAMQLRLTRAPLGEVFSFVSGLYFRGKLAYAHAFAEPASAAGELVFIITSTQGLVSAGTLTGARHLREMAEVPIHIRNEQYRVPLERDLLRLAARLDKNDKVVLLGSVATPKYLEPLREVLPSQLVIPAAFIGLGDMGRGAVMLRAVRQGRPLRLVAPHLALR